MLQLNDELELAGLQPRRVSIRNLQSHDKAAEQLTPVTRAAVNLRGLPVEEVSRGDVLVTPGAWFSTGMVAGAGSDDVDFTGIAQEFPLHIGDRFVLRGTGQHLITGGATVVDVDPPALRRRGAAKRRAETLAAVTESNHLAVDVQRRGAMKTTTVSAMGIPVVNPLPDS